MTTNDASAPDVDWETLRRRLHEVRASLERTTQLGAEMTRSVLDQRAAVLAIPIRTSGQTDSREAIVFRLGFETYAIEAQLVLNVFRLSGLALLPGATPPVYGVTMWRGEVLTLLDLRRSLGLSTGALTDLGRVIVLGHNRAAFGFLADALLGVRAIGENEIHATPARMGGKQALVRGITSDAVLVLDGEQVLDLANTGA